MHDRDPSAELANREASSAVASAMRKHAIKCACRMCLQGRAVGSAAHLTALRRERIGEHDVVDAWQMPDLVAAAAAARERASG